jgi:two-component system, chemotaxis family, sensor kinase CheA
MAQDPYRYFRIEAKELVEQLGQGALELEKGGDGEIVARLLRLAHTLKGAARVVKQREIAEQAHAIEEVLVPLREAPDKIERGSVGAVLARLDTIAEQLALLGSPEAPAAAAKALPAADEALRTVRADIGEVDGLLEGVTETYAQFGALRRTLGTFDRARPLLEFLMAQLAGRRGGAAVSEASWVERTSSIAEELRGLFDGLAAELSHGVDQAERELAQVRDAAEQLRLSPLDALFGVLERVARDTAEAQGKRVSFAARGAELRLEADLIGAIQSALVQVVKNAVAHGIETESERRSAGKPAAGSVTIDVERRGRRVVFVCRDDGRGVDLEAVKRSASLRGVPAFELGKLADQQLLDLLLKGGISTSAAVTDVSGRGIGLDIVREAGARLGGEVSVRSEPGKGTAFVLSFPLAVASMEVLSVASGDLISRIPLDAVRRTVRLGPAEIARTARGASVTFEGSAVPLVELSQALRVETDSRPSGARSAVIVQGLSGVAAIAVDRLLGTANVVLRPLPELGPADPMIAGVSLDAEGNPQLVLDPDGLVAFASRGRARETAAVAERRPVLVVDDSLTTRMLEQSILEAAGFSVDVAVSAEEALETARRKRYALFLVDVEMPGMDGFGFVESIRKDPVLHDTPAILVTSRSSAEDFQRGRDVGAQGYMVKSEFDQNALVSQINRLVG